mgnify:CR=1 FL=1
MAKCRSPEVEKDHEPQLGPLLKVQDTVQGTLALPAGHTYIPQPHATKVLNAMGNQALQDPDLREKILSQGNELGGGTPEQFAALIKVEAPRWAKVVRDAKIEPE